MSSILIAVISLSISIATIFVAVLSIYIPSKNAKKNEFKKEISAISNFTSQAKKFNPAFIVLTSNEDKAMMESYIHNYALNTQETFSILYHFFNTRITSLDIIKKVDPTINSKTLFFDKYNFKINYSFFNAKRNRELENSLEILGQAIKEGYQYANRMLDQDNIKVKYTENSKAMMSIIIKIESEISILFSITKFPTSRLN